MCGYPPRDLVERTSFVARNRETVERIAAETQGIAVICGLVTPGSLRHRQGRHEFRRPAHGRQGRLHPVENVAAHLRRLRRDAQFCSSQESGPVFVLRQSHGANHLRGCVERQALLAQAAVHGRSRGVLDSCRREFRAEYFRVSVLDRQARTSPRHAGQHCPPAQGSRRAGESGWRQRQPGIRRLQPRAQSGRANHCAGPVVRRRP